MTTIDDMRKAKEIIEGCIGQYYDVVWLNVVDDIVDTLFANDFKIIKYETGDEK